MLPGQLKPEHTVAAVSLTTFEPMARCLVDHADSLGFDAGAMLNRVEAAGEQNAASAEWARAVREVEPLRTKLQTHFLSQEGRESQSFLQRAIAGSKAKKPALARSAGEMDIDEVRVCQVWVYGLASRLRACQQLAHEFAVSSGMTDPNTPLQGYDEERWDPRAPPWRDMESCVHVAAAKAGTETDIAWRRRAQS